MRSSNGNFRLGTFVFLAFLAVGCGKASSTTSTGPTVTSTIVSRPNGTTLPALTGANVVPFTVNGTTCSANSYPNKPCVSVLVCPPNTTDTTLCQTVNDVLLDTGSYGLRIFKSVITAGSPSITTTPVTAGSNGVAECVEYGDGTQQWGSVQLASVGLGGETPVTVPIQLIDSTYSGGPPASSNCTSPVTSVSSAGFNGILGVGLFKQDCGSTCASGATGIYFQCTGTSCSGTSLPLASQVQNPVSLLPTDNNGVIIELPNIPTGGVVSTAGYLVLGIGTQSNNAATGVTMYNADSSVGEFSTKFNGNTYDSFLDTGSNALSFAGNSQTPDCGTQGGTNYSGWLCPTSTVTLSATNISYSGLVNGVISFPLSNFVALWNSPNNAFIDIGSSASGNISGFFDWGLPFFFGRNTYIGIEAKTSTLGTGPYWAF